MMRYFGVALMTTLMARSLVWGQGVLLPSDESQAPANIVYQRVNVVVREQAAQTRVEQEFKNHTSQPMEAVYLFPVPVGTSVNDFVLWVDGKKTKGELIDSNQARQIYSQIVRRLRDPGLLERMTDQLFRVRVFPIPPQGTQKIELSYTQVLPREGGLVEYLYPKANMSTATEKDFTLRVDIESSSNVKNVYSPTHSVGITREGDKRAIVGFEESPSMMNRDFRLLWSVDDREIGLSYLPFRDSANDDGYLLLLLSPSESLSSATRVPRDVVFVVDTSGSMAGPKMEQAKKALQHCISRLDPNDRFNVVRFATTAEPWEKELTVGTPEKKSLAGDWVSKFEPTGGTAIAAALELALTFRSGDGRSLAVVFLTDGQPTIGLTDTPSILAIADKNRDREAVRLFLFGVGDDVNAPLLDQLADRTKGTTTYVRPSENLEVKVSSFFDKISHPVLTNLKLQLGNSSMVLKEVFPPQLPDLFHGSQLVVFARYSGAGPTSIELQGSLGSDFKTLRQEMTLPAEPTAGGNKMDFVASLWGQRKVGFLLDQIRIQGENKELIDEVTRVAKKFGIVTPYTSYLIAPDEKSPPVAGIPPRPMSPILPRFGFGNLGFGNSSSIDTSSARGPKMSAGGLGGGGGFGRDGSNTVPFEFDMKDQPLPTEAGRELKEESGALAIDVAQAIQEMKQAERTFEQSKRVGGRSFVLVRGVWVEEGLDPKKEILRVQFLSDAYFEIASASIPLRGILALGSRVVFMGDNGQAVSIEASGLVSLSDDHRRQILGP
ncbi:VWA domain-containing protein [bacterium]|nr:VWA domain-containing protein [bacterium]